MMITIIWAKSFLEDRPMIQLYIVQDCVIMRMKKWHVFLFKTRHFLAVLSNSNLNTYSGKRQNRYIVHNSLGKTI